MGVTVDDLLHGDDRPPYRIGRRTGDPKRGIDHTLTILDGAGSDVRIDLVHLAAREAGGPVTTGPGIGIVVVASGLVQVKIASQTAAVRHGEVLVTGGDRIGGWRNLGQAEAVLFWVLLAESTPGRRPVEH